MTAEELEELGAILGHRFAHPERLEQALTHRSRRQNDAASDNERLEFLGDRVLGLVASEMLCHAFPEWDAGKLSKGLARLVNAVSLHAAAEQLHLGDFLRLGPGEEKTGGRAKKRLLADAYEAVLGAIYLDAGLPAARQFLRHTLLDQRSRRRGRRPGSFRSQVRAPGMVATAWAGGRSIPRAQ